jgi:hypothetical protein
LRIPHADEKILHLRIGRIDVVIQHPEMEHQHVVLGWKSQLAFRG